MNKKLENYIIEANSTHRESRRIGIRVIRGADFSYTILKIILDTALKLMYNIVIEMENLSIIYMSKAKG